MNVGNITVSGPVGIGKSLVLFRIAQILKEEFGADVTNTDDGQYYDTDPPADWELDMVKNTKWILNEQVDHGETKRE